MAKLGGTFDATSVEPQRAARGAAARRLHRPDRAVRDAGHQGRHRPDALARHGGAGGAATRAGTLYDQLNLVNPNPTAEEIAQRTLSRDLPRDRQAAGRGQRGAALPCRCWSASRSSRQRLQRGQGLQAGQAGRGSRHADPGSERADADPAHSGTAGAPGAGGQRDRALEEERLIRTKAAPSPIEFGDTAATALSPQAFGERPWRTGTLVPRAPARQGRAAGDPRRVPGRDRPAARRDRRDQGADRDRRPRAPGQPRQDGPALVPPGADRDPPQAPADRGAHRAPADAAAGPEGRAQGLPDRGPARRVRRRGAGRASSIGRTRCTTSGRRLMAPLPPRASPTRRGDPRRLRGRRRRRLPRASRRLADRPGVRPGALVRVPLDHARRATAAACCACSRPAGSRRSG